MFKIEPNTSETVEHFICRLLNAAAARTEKCGGEFNGTLLVAAPGSDWRSVYEQWDLPRRREYFGSSQKFGTVPH